MDLQEGEFVVAAWKDGNSYCITNKGRFFVLWIIPKLEWKLVS